MFKLKVTVTKRVIPVDVASLLERAEVEIPCPSCALETAANLGEVRRGETIICRGCHANIHLTDGLADVQRAEARLASVFAALGGR